MILLLDIGKTNKKCFVFDEDYQIVYERITQISETTDEEGDFCEDLDLLKTWVMDAVREVLQDARFQIRAVNCTTYGASFVHLDSDGQPLTPLYNYLKPFPPELRKRFFETYGGEIKIALETASPVLGNLNSGLQLYWLKNYKPLVFNKIKWSLHLPQYVSFLISLAINSPGDFKSPGEFIASEITSIGCHTMLWDFQKKDYHDWVKAEGIVEKFPPIKPSNGAVQIPQSSNSPINIGTGLHDSSAALIPYLSCFEEPFVLISTGTWCISLNPFNQEPLIPEELAQDCLSYLSYEGKPVKAARYFGGHEHEQAVKKIAAEFGVSEDSYKSEERGRLRNLQGFVNVDSKYLAFMRQLVEKQVISTRLAIGNTPVRRVFVDGGFSKNETYMTLLARAFPKVEVFAAEVAQATALGAAMVIHEYWNEKPLSKKLISLKKFLPNPALTG